jgi:choline dehydrogenase-like flavoprotein
MVYARYAVAKYVFQSGGGTAGLTLAARLSEDVSNTVCVLEAGDLNLHDPVIREGIFLIPYNLYPHEIHAVRPASYAVHFGNKTYDWGHVTVGRLVK